MSKLNFGSKGGIKGHVAVTVEDRHGNIKQRAEADNMLSDAALAAILLAGVTSNTPMRQTAGLNGALSVSQQAGVLSANTFGIYAMNEDVDWQKSMIKPPYVKENFTSLHDRVSFFSWAENKSDVDNLLAMGTTRCYFDGVSNTHNIEYTKSMGNAGTVKSVGIGTAHTSNNSVFNNLLTGVVWGTYWNDPFPQPFFTATPYNTPVCMLEHLADRTIAYSLHGSNMLRRYDLLGKLNTDSISASVSTSNAVQLIYTKQDGTRYSLTNIANQGVPSDTVHNITAGVCVNFAASTTKTYTVPVGDVTLDINRNAAPIAVFRPDTKQFELFLSLDYDADGCRLIKGVLDAEDLPNAVPQWIEMGKIPYVIGTAGTATGVASQVFGYYDVDTQTYWLPYSGVIEADGTLTVAAVTNAQYGIKIKGVDGTFDEHTIEDYYVAQMGSPQTVVSSLGGIMDIVKSTYGVSQFFMRTSTQGIIRYVKPGVVWSGVNLPQAVHRSASDVLRIIYSYSQGNAE
jgi:hypothetical protein